MKRQTAVQRARAKARREREYAARLREVRKLMNTLYATANALGDALEEWDSSFTPFLRKPDRKVLAGECVEVQDFLDEARDGYLL